LSSVTVERDLLYATGDGDIALGLDLYRSAQAHSPLVVYLHGGGWLSGDKADAAEQRLVPLAEYGVTVAAVNYRLVPAASLPDQLHDVKGAVRWLRAHGPSLGLPTDRLGVWGASAGAYLGSLLALSAGDPELEGSVGGNLGHSSAVQAVVHWFGQSDLVASGSRTEIESRLLPFNFEAGVLAAARLSDVTARARHFGLLGRVRQQVPPFLIAHGDRDHVVSFTEGQALHDALSRAGADTTFMLIGGEGHEGKKFAMPAALAMTAAWLCAELT
jgi:acetyl esterase/lipase